MPNSKAANVNSSKHELCQPACGLKEKNSTLVGRRGTLFSSKDIFLDGNVSNNDLSESTETTIATIGSGSTLDATPIPSALLNKERGQSKKVSGSSKPHRISLPDGQLVTLGACTKLLVDAMAPVLGQGEDGRYFRVQEGWRCMTSLFPAASEHEIEAFVQELLKKGVLHFKNTDCDIHQENSQMILQPFVEPAVLNSFLKWPFPPRKAKCLDVVLMLSRLMDTLHLAKPEQRMSTLQDFEEAVCHLQVLQAPSRQSPDRLAFELNLHNIIVRHARLIQNQRKWIWPTSISDLFWKSVGYNIGGKYMTAFDLQQSLLHNFNDTIENQGQRWWSHLQCCRSRSDTETNSSAAIGSKQLEIMCSLTLGCSGSPRGLTIDPDNLTTCLRSSAEAICQSQVTIRRSGSPLRASLQLPALIGMYTGSLPMDADTCLLLMLPYLNDKQLMRLSGLVRRFKVLQLSFKTPNPKFWNSPWSADWINSNVSTTTATSSTLIPKDQKTSSLTIFGSTKQVLHAKTIAEIRRRCRRRSSEHTPVSTLSTQEHGIPSNLGSLPVLPGCRVSARASNSLIDESDQALVVASSPNPHKRDITWTPTPINPGGELALSIPSKPVISAALSQLPHRQQIRRPRLDDQEHGGRQPSEGTLGLTTTPPRRQTNNKPIADARRFGLLGKPQKICDPRSNQKHMPSQLLRSTRRSRNKISDHRLKHEEQVRGHHLAPDPRNKKYNEQEETKPRRVAPRQPVSDLVVIPDPPVWHRAVSDLTLSTHGGRRIVL